MIRLFEKAWRCGVCILGLHVCLFLDRRLVIEEKKVLDEGPGWILGFMMAALFLGTMYLDALVILPLRFQLALANVRLSLRRLSPRSDHSPAAHNVRDAVLADANHTTLADASHTTLAHTGLDNASHGKYTC
jgi:hypothetical protein